MVSAGADGEAEGALRDGCVLDAGNLLRVDEDGERAAHCDGVYCVCLIGTLFDCGTVSIFSDGIDSLMRNVVFEDTIVAVLTEADKVKFMMVCECRR